MRKTFAAGLIALGFLMAALTLCTVRYAMAAEPEILEPPAAAAATAQQWLDAVCRGDDVAASALLYGTPSFGSAPVNASPAAAQLWEAYRSSLEYKSLGECYATASGVAMDATIRVLDTSKLLGNLEEKVQSQLDQKIGSGKDSSQLFEDDGSLKSEEAEAILSDALLLALGRQMPLREQTITLSLIYEQGAWWVLPEGDALSVLSGAFSG